MKILENKWVYFAIITFLFLTFFASLAVAETISPADVNPSIPGTDVSSQQNPNPAGIIINFYQFALMIGGLLAFVIIVFAAIKHTVSADNPSGQSDSKDMIKQALLGLLLLVGAYLVLNTINPKLTDLRLPELEKIPKVKVTVINNPGALNNPCLAGSVCNAGLLCSSDDICYKPSGCTTTSDCPYLSLQQCIGGVCKEVLNTCDASTPCDINHSCVDGLCKQRGTAGAACINGGCPNGDGLVCSRRSICVVSGTCITSGDCSTAQECVANKCVASSAGSVCTSQADCGGALACGASGQCLPPFSSGCRRNVPETQKCDAPYACWSDQSLCALPCSDTSSCPKTTDGAQLTCKLPVSGGSVKFCLR